MSDTNVVTSQPVAAANNLLPSAPPENVVVSQPLNNVKQIPLKVADEKLMPKLTRPHGAKTLNNFKYIPLNEPAENGADMHVNTYSFKPPSAPNMTEQPVNNDEKIMPELTRADAMQSEEEERRRRRRNDYCCFACADSYVDDDTFWRCYCQCLGQFCEGVSNCTESFCDGCASCSGSCCESGDQDGCCDGCCENSAGDAVTGGDAGGRGDGDGGDADCDCDCDCL